MWFASCSLSDSPCGCQTRQCGYLPVTGTAPMLSNGFEGHRSRGLPLNDDLCLDIKMPGDQFRQRNGLGLLVGNKSGIKRSGNPPE